MFIDHQDKVSVTIVVNFVFFKACLLCNAYTFFLMFIHSIIYIHFINVSTQQAGETAAHVASRYGHPEVLNTLCFFKANLNLQDNVKFNLKYHE